MHAHMRKPPSFRHDFSRRWALVAFNLLAAIALAACGGGGGGNGGGQQQQNNTAPSVNAGADQTITLPATASLSGSATDAQGQTLTYQWSGPSGVTFASATSAATTATFAAAGTYTLTLTASDGSLTGTDTVTVTVQAAANTAPTVNAGADQTITLPANSVQLTGSATDAENNTLTYQWTSEPSTGVTFANATQASTTATFTTAGAYTLTLTANDGTNSAADALTVTVNPPATTVFWPGLDNDDSVPDYGWTRVAPDQVGMDAARLTEAANYALTAGGAGMVVRGGRLVHSWATGTTSSGAPVTIDTRFASQSSTKSIGGMALGIAIDDGLIAADLSQRARVLLPTFGQPPATNDPALLDMITLAQLATHTAGFEKFQTDPDLLHTPGTTFRYSDGGLNWLADVLTTVFNADLRDVLTTNVWSQLGVNPPGPLANDDVQWRSNQSRPPTLPNGVVTRELSSGIQINANAMARVGLLYLRNGEWSTGRILSQAFIDLSKTPRPENANLANPQAADFPGAPANYGVLWWTNRTCQLTGVPSDAYWAWGQYDSLIVVIPSLDLVISRIGPVDAVDRPGRVLGENNWNADYAVLAPLLNPIVASTGATGTICTP